MVLRSLQYLFKHHMVTLNVSGCQLGFLMNQVQYVMKWRG